MPSDSGRKSRSSRWWLGGLGLAALLPALWLINARVARPSNLGVRDGRLAACPESPNCVGSQEEDPGHRVEPFGFQGSPAEAMTRLRRILEGRRGTRLIEERPDYLAYEFRTAVCRFVDDVEFLVDPAARVIHVRSGSRIGYSDLGANRRRVEEIRRRWAEGNGP